MRIAYRDSRSSKEEGPDALAGRGQSLRLLAVWGTITGLFDADACASDLGSNLRDVTASTKRLSSHSKGAGQHQRLCLVPHTCRFLGQQSLGVEPAVKSMPLHLRPALPFREKRTTSPTRGKLSVARRLFCGLVFAYRALAVKKGRPQRRSVCRGRVLPNWPFGGRIAIIPSDTGGSDASVPRCRD